MFLLSVDKQELYERVLILIAQWCQPHVDIDKDDIRTRLDTQAEDIFKSLVDNMLIDQKKISSPEDLRRVELEPALCRRVLDTANQNLAEAGFKGNSDNYYLADNSFINRVLDTKLGIPISLSLMYSCILARLGIICEPINFPRHFLLRWLEHPELTVPNQRYSYIDVFNGGQRLTATEALEQLGPELVQPDNIFHVATPVEAAQRMLRNLISIGGFISISIFCFN